MSNFTRMNHNERVYDNRYYKVNKIEKMISDEIDKPNTDIHKLRVLDLKKLKTIDDLKKYRI